MLTINNNYWKKRNVVEVNYAAWDFILGKCALPEVYRNVYNAFPDKDHVGMYLGPKPILILRNLEDIQSVLLNDFQSFHSRGYFVNSKEVLADNLLLISDYCRWKLIRQKMSPVFTISKIKSMYQTIYRCASDLKEYVRDKNVRKDPLRFLDKYNFVAIGMAIFGLDFSTSNTIETSIVDTACSSANCQLVFTLKMLINNTFPKLFNFFNMNTFGDHKDLIMKIMKQVLNERRKMPGKRHDYIDMCLEIQKEETILDKTTGFELRTTDEFIATQAFSLFFAGVETSGTTLNFTLLELANNESVLEKVHKEIDEAFANRDHLTYQDIEDLVYLDQVLNESLRKYPPIGSMQRVATQDTILPSNLRIEEGTVVIVPIYGLHMDNKYFENPDIFDPDRFSPDNKAEIQKYSYIPFGEGNRICIGKERIIVL
ncbi:unnamed protein product [Leptosia nina]|uniref:unspecific monooxygenase n=1 Tax=Leptosia nina TaxID=320188 RepID=A0AAV1IYG8_9NEOP